MIPLILFCAFSRDLANLDHDDFQVRRAAHARLKAHSAWCWQLVEGHGQHTSSLEARVRCRRLVAAELAVPYRCPPLWALHYRRPKSMALGTEGKIYATDLPWWLDPFALPGIREEGLVSVAWSRQATETCYVKLRRLGIPRCLLDPIVRGMKEKEEEWAIQLP